MFLLVLQTLCLLDTKKKKKKLIAWPVLETKGGHLFVWQTLSLKVHPKGQVHKSSRSQTAEPLLVVIQVFHTFI